MALDLQDEPLAAGLAVARARATPAGDEETAAY